MNPIIERDNYFINPINDRKFSYEHGNREDRRRAMRACEENITLVMLSKPLTPRALVNMHKQPASDGSVNSQPEPNTSNPYKMMLDSGREYSSKLRAELLVKANDFDRVKAEQDRLAEIKSSDSYQISLQHARACVASTKSGAMPESDARTRLLLELEASGNWQQYRDASDELDRKWYAQLDQQAAEKRATMAELDQEAKDLENTGRGL